MTATAASHGQTVQLRASFKSPWARATCLLAAVILTFFLFHAPLVTASAEYRKAAETATWTGGTAGAQHEERAKIVVELVKNAVGEIRLYQEEEDRWFHNKFILIGALLGAFLARFALEKGAGADGEARLGGLISSSTTCCALAFATIVALTIDVHVRAGTTKIYQIGNWLAYFAEPALLQSSFQGGPSNFLPWEMSLREISHGMHADTLYSFALEPNLHLTTLIIYLAYLGVLQELSLKRHSTNVGLTVALFCAVQFTLLLFAWMAHTGPGALQTQPIPLVDFWPHADKAGFLYVVPWLGVTALSAPYLWHLWRHSRPERARRRSPSTATDGPGP
jgi:hypothetical protein